MRKRRCIFCDYLSFTDPILRSKFRLPLVNIRIKHNNISFKTVALVDSGATATFMPFDFIGILNLTQKKEEAAVGAGGIFKVMKEKIDLIEIIKRNKSFCDLRSFEVSFPLSPNSIPYAVLGRDSIFQMYDDVTFREYEKHIMFKHPKF
jgi:hypothetical protein